MSRPHLVSAGRDALVASAPEYEYSYDDIGNRLASLDLGDSRVYQANSLNQYTSISNAASTAEAFVPQFDLDGNQTLVRTTTGDWSVTYNGENRPVCWTCGATNIVMSFDRMGRRVEYLETTSTEESVISDGETNLVVTVTTNAHHRFVYDGYLCIQRLNAAANNAVDLAFGWDPTEPVATRPLWVQRPAGSYNFFYFHDGNKNVSELVSYQAARGVPAHYEYAPFGAVTAATTNTAFTAFNVAETNPFRFSSEYADDALGLVYYNYRHYEPMMGRWMQRDPVGEDKGVNIFGFIRNNGILGVDVRGLFLGSLGSNFRKCPEGQTWTFKNIARVPKADGCSNPFKGWILGKAGEGIAKIFPGLPDYSGDPDAPFSGVSFLSACDYHDYCYSNCHKGKDDCDKGLRRLAKKACTGAASKKSFSNQKERDDWVAKCDAWANAYYNAVKAAGQNSYENRQKKACECNCSKRDLRFGAFDEKLEHYYPPITP